MKKQENVKTTLKSAENKARTQSENHQEKIQVKEDRTMKADSAKISNKNSWMAWMTWKASKVRQALKIQRWFRWFQRSTQFKLKSLT